MFILMRQVCFLIHNVEIEQLAEYMILIFNVSTCITLLLATEYWIISIKKKMMKKGISFVYSQVENLRKLLSIMLFYVSCPDDLPNLRIQLFLLLFFL